MNQPPIEGLMPRDEKGYHQLSDEDLILHYKSTLDNQYVGLLFKRYSHVVYGISLKYLKHRQDAEDMMVTVFEKLLDVLVEKKVDTFRTWLFVLVRNQCISRLRSMKTEMQRKERYTEYLAQLKTPEHIFGDDYVRMRDEEEAVLMMIMKDLPAKQRICIQYFYFENKSYLQIAEILGEKVGKVRSYIQNGRRNLGKMMNDRS